MTATFMKLAGLHRPTRKLPCRMSGGSPFTEEDREYMNRALQLARRQKGKTYPNPTVGCLIVKNNSVIGQGYHPKAGMPHAEVYALRAAGRDAEGSTAYVTLEPCSHYGRTPPCSQALIDARISKVVIGVGDLNPMVAAKGVQMLRDAGMDVTVGCLEEMCYDINRDFMERMQQL